MNATRAAQLTDLMQRNGYQALVCWIPQHVLMLSGYAPLLGNTFCIVSFNQAGEPEIRLVLPKPEEELLPQGRAVEVRTFTEETMDSISNAIEAARGPLAGSFRSAGLGFGATVGYEGGYTPIATNYTQVGVPGPATLAMLDVALPGARWRDATQVLDRLAEIKTDEELQAIRRAAEVAHQGFQAAREAIHVGATEAEVAAAATAALLRAGYRLPGVRVVQPHVHVMSGARAAEAFKAFNLTTNAPIQQGDTVSVQLEVGIDGYWVELTRPFFAGEVSNEWQRAYDACRHAQQDAFDVISDGAAGREVDAAARRVMQAAGFGDAFKHGLGHGIGFQAINHADAPALHPASDAVLRAGMASNIEPAVYLEGKGGIRLNDNIAVRQDGCELLSEVIPRELDWLVVD
jgi:Xaa-Pro aminopeptidase